MFLSSAPQTGLFSLSVTYPNCLPMGRPPCTLATLKQRKANIFHAFGAKWPFSRAVTVVTTLIRLAELIPSNAWHSERGVAKCVDDKMIAVIMVVVMKSLVYHVEPRTVGHFRITFGLFFKASPGAHPFIWKLIFIHMQMKTNFYMKRWAPGLALKKRPKVIRKRSIVFLIWEAGNQIEAKTLPKQMKLKLGLLAGKENWNWHRENSTHIWHPVNDLNPGNNGGRSLPFSCFLTDMSNGSISVLVAAYCELRRVFWTWIFACPPGQTSSILLFCDQVAWINSSTFHFLMRR